MYVINFFYFIILKLRLTLLEIDHVWVENYRSNS